MNDTIIADTAIDPKIQEIIDFDQTLAAGQVQYLEPSDAPYYVEPAVDHFIPVDGMRPERVQELLAQLERPLIDREPNTLAHVYDLAGRFIPGIERTDEFWKSTGLDGALKRVRRQLNGVAFAGGYMLVNVGDVVIYGRVVIDGQEMIQFRTHDAVMEQVRAEARQAQAEFLASHPALKMPEWATSHHLDLPEPERDTNYATLYPTAAFGSVRVSGAINYHPESGQLDTEDAAIYLNDIDFPTQVSAAEARQLAQNLIEAADLLEHIERGA